jgi:uncharacterized protein (DUF2236 family)
MRLPWTNRRQRRFEWLLTCLRGSDRVIPHGLWVFGYRLYSQEMPSRARRGKRII